MYLKILYIQQKLKQLSGITCLDEAHTKLQWQNTFSILFLLKLITLCSVTPVMLSLIC